MNAEMWKNKILAYLHDPPEKASMPGPKHRQGAGTAEIWALGPTAM
jgi:hypothetical protein